MALFKLRQLASSPIAPVRHDLGSSQQACVQVIRIIFLPGNGIQVVINGKRGFSQKGKAPVPEAFSCKESGGALRKAPVLTTRKEPADITPTVTMLLPMRRPAFLRFKSVAFLHIPTLDA